MLGSPTAAVTRIGTVAGHLPGVGPIGTATRAQHRRPRRLPPPPRRPASACARFKSDDGGIERGDHIGVRAPRIILPVLDRPGRLPFQGDAGIMGGQTKLIASTHNRSDRAEWRAVPDCTRTGILSDVRAKDPWHQRCSSAISCRARAGTPRVLPMLSGRRLECQAGMGLGLAGSACRELGAKPSRSSPTASNRFGVSAVGMQSNGMSYLRRYHGQRLCRADAPDPAERGDLSGG